MDGKPGEGRLGREARIIPVRHNCPGPTFGTAPEPDLRMSTPELDPINETSPEAEPRFAVVPDSAAGRRFDAVLAELFPEFSRSRLSEWIKTGDALLEGKQVRGRDPVRGGESVSLIVVLDIQTTAAPEDIPLDVLYEDEAVFVL